jgi:CheY-like chemotaxis protein
METRIPDLRRRRVEFLLFPTTGRDRSRHDQAVILDVLVVDDDPWFRAVARQLLESAGFTVVGEADSATQALACVAALKPSAVLLDVSLPDGDGLSLARELGTLPWRPRIVLTSSDPDAVTDGLAKRSSAVAFVPKEELTDARLRAAFAVG